MGGGIAGFDTMGVRGFEGLLTGFERLLMAVEGGWWRKFRKKSIAMNRFSKTVLLTGLFVGTTDILSAFVMISAKSGHFPKEMFHYIAGAALGIQNGLNGGIWTNLLGLFFHYLIAGTATLAFFTALPRVRALRFNKYLVGMLYAVFVNLFMTFAVLPLTALPPGGFDFARTFIDWIVLGCLLGIPIAFNAYRFYGY